MISTGGVDFVAALYRRYAADLLAVVEQQRATAADGRCRPGLDDLEAEITYLLLRQLRPEHVVEIGTSGGRTTSWLLSALRDNGSGRLVSFHRARHPSVVPDELAADRWTVHTGDVRARIDALPETTDYLLLDAAHTARFGRWYVRTVFPRLASGTPVGVHEVYRGRSTWARGEGGVVLDWLAERDVPHFTVAPRRAPQIVAALTDLRRELGVGDARTAGANPMIWFEMP
ncbi:class I SAM-dependent methyltransferase [Pseudonocardia kujensis]|uniref:class I SAM-dependent methyltransferase n=1 Tax=Pseudonocardia kujensis TaxID=1128675 RepID=UPI001E2BA625|nr:class I SAM-dependent methyltransferase [Pseudonocardia kujensis]MCE0767250.1 class I SAM-dependent methyltransferase [Pseudonocardia kujensis]